VTRSHRLFLKGDLIMLKRLAVAATAALSIAVLLGGCATTNETNRQQVMTGTIPRPNMIWVYDFAASPDDVPPNSALAGQGYAAPETPEQLAAGRALGAQIAGELVADIQAMGMPAAIGSAGTRPALNDVVVEGTVLSVQAGNAAERVTIGFAAGESELKVAVEGFHMTSVGLKEIGQGDLNSTSAKSPGMSVGLASSLIMHNPAGILISTGMKAYGEESGNATVQGRAKQIADKVAAIMKQRFQQQGWL
jgi:hypothetical protein